MSHVTISSTAASSYDRRTWLTPPLLIVGLLVIDVLMGVAAAGSYLLTTALGVENPELFQLGLESNIPTWWSTIQLFAIALALGIWAWHHKQRSTPRAWWLWLAPAFFAFLSLDEIAMLHERIGDFVNATVSSKADLEAMGLRTGLWMVVCFPVFLLGLAFMIRAVWPLIRTKTAILKKAALGMVILVGSAVGIEMVSNFFATGSIALKIMGMLEEVGEMIGATVLLWAAWGLLKSDRVTFRFGQG